MALLWLSEMCHIWHRNIPVYYNMGPTQLESITIHADITADFYMFGTLSTSYQKNITVMAPLSALWLSLHLECFLEL